MVNCRGPSIPYSLIARFDKDNRELTIVRNKEVNEELRHAVMSLDLPSTHFFTVPSDQGKVVTLILLLCMTVVYSCCLLLLFM